MIKTGAPTTPPASALALFRAAKRRLTLLLPRACCSTAAGSASGSGLPALLSSLLVGVRQRLGPLLDATLAPGSALRSIDLLSNAVLDEVQAALAAAMPGEGPGRGGLRARALCGHWSREPLL